MIFRLSVILPIGTWVADGPPTLGGTAMSVPPPPGAGDFFAAPTSPPPLTSPYGYSAPAPAPGTAYTGFGAPGTGFTAPGSARMPARVSANRVPEPVTVACTLMGVFASIGAFTVLVVIMLSSGSSSGADTSASSSGTGIGIGAIYAVLWGGSGFINAALIVYLRRGNAVARIVTSVISGLWVVYWLHLLVEIMGRGTSDGIIDLSSLAHVGELLMLGLTIASALPAALLWWGSAKEHFA
jgi:hypothetical protein